MFTHKPKRSEAKTNPKEMTMKTTFAAAFLFLAGATGALAAPASGPASAQASADLSGALGQSVANGTALVGLSVGTPLMAVGALGETMVEGAVLTIGKPLPLADETIYRGPAPDAALRNRMEAR